MNRCVTRNASLCTGIRSVVGSAARLKSGCSGSTRTVGIGRRGAPAVAARRGGLRGADRAARAPASTSRLHADGLSVRHRSRQTAPKCTSKTDRHRPLMYGKARCPRQRTRPRNAGETTRTRSVTDAENALRKYREIRGRLFDPMFGEVIAQGALADPHRFGRVFLHAVGGLQRAADGLALGPIEVLAQRASTAVRPTATTRRRAAARRRRRSSRPARARRRARRCSRARGRCPASPPPAALPARPARGRRCACRRAARACATK